MFPRIDHLKESFVDLCFLILRLFDKLKFSRYSISRHNLRLNITEADCDWSKMPVEILHQIAAKLISVEDLLAFSVVCHTWHSACTQAKSKWIPQMPWLMLAENTEDIGGHLRKFFDASNSKCRKLKIPETFMCWGSAYGWIVAMNLNLDIFMFNPLTGAQIKLPSAHTLPASLVLKLIDSEFIMNIKRLCRFTLDRVILLKVPRGGNEEEFLAVFISACSGPICIARPNDSIWTLIVKGNEMRTVSDVAYWNGALFLVDSKGATSYVELNDDSMRRTCLTAIYYLPPGPIGELVWFTRCHRLYLTESFGHLLLILRVRKEEMHNNDNGDDVDDDGVEIDICNTIFFRVFKLNDKTKEWEYLEDLEEISIFVGSNSTMAIQVREFTDCRRNCIYFADDDVYDWERQKGFGGRDMGIFSIDKGMFEPIYEGEDSRSRFCCPFWFVPKL